MEKVLSGVSRITLRCLLSGFDSGKALALSLLGFFGLVGCGGSAVELLKDSDTGYEDFNRADKLTNDATPSLRVRGEKGKEVEAFVGDKSVGTGTLSQNSGEADITVSLANDKDFTELPNRVDHYQDHTVEFRYKEGGVLGSITIRLDTVKPEVPSLKVKDLDSTRKSLSDASGKAVVVEFEASNVEAGSSVILLSGTTKLAEIHDVSGGTNTIRGKITATQSVTVRVYDKAGNFSESGAITVGTTGASLAYDEIEYEEVNLEGGYDEKVFIFRIGEKEWEIRGSLYDSGTVFMERGDTRLEVATSGRDHDFILKGSGYGDWRIGIEGDDQMQVLGVGLDWSVSDA